MECVRGRIIKIGCTRKCHKVYLMISSPHVRESRTILVSRFRIQETGFQYLSLKLGFWIPIVSEISDSTTKDSGFHKQNFPIFRNPRFPYMGRISPKIYIYIYIYIFGGQRGSVFWYQQILRTKYELKCLT